MSTCANCGDVLAGEYCSRCGQRARDLHRPFGALVSDAVGDIFNLDTRLVRTLRPLMLKPGAVAKDYIASRRASHVPPSQATHRRLLQPSAAHRLFQRVVSDSAGLGLSLFAWLLAYLPIALRRVYGGSRLMTGVKLVTLGGLYAFSFGAAQPLIIGAALLQF